MKAFLYSAALQVKLDFRNKDIVVIYYIVPLVFFLFMGGIFTAINPEADGTLIQTMTIFGVTMGAMLGSPVPLVDLYGSDIKKAFKVGNIPMWVGAAINFLSAFVHLMVVSGIIFILSLWVFKAELPQSIPGYFLGLALFIAASLGIGTVLGLLVKKTSKLTMTAQIVFLPSVMLSGIMFPVSLLPEPLRVVGSILPAASGYRLMTWADDMRSAVVIMCVTVIAMGVVIGVKLKFMAAE